MILHLDLTEFKRLKGLFKLVCKAIFAIFASTLSHSAVNIGQKIHETLKLELQSNQIVKE